jgi:Na+-driven multidrug efflux pump
VARTLWRLGGPIAMQTVAASLFGFLDTLMVSAPGTGALVDVGLDGTGWQGDYLLFSYYIRLFG